MTELKRSKKKARAKLLKLAQSIKHNNIPRRFRQFLNVSAKKAKPIIAIARK